MAGKGRSDDQKSGVEKAKKTVSKKSGPDKPTQPAARVEKPKATSAKPKLTYKSSPAAAQVAKIRNALSAVSEKRWSELVAEIKAAPEPARETPDPYNGLLSGYDRYGKRILLQGVDHSFQRVTFEGTRVVVHKSSGSQIGIVLEPFFNSLVDAADRVKLTFGFDESHAWDVIATLDGLDHFHDTTGLAVDRIPTVRAEAFRRPGQFLVSQGGSAQITIPGLDEAMDKLTVIHKKSRIPRAKEPKDLLPALVEILETNNISLFEAMWNKPMPEYMVRRRFSEYVRAFRACRGRMGFERYDKRLSLENAGELGQVKMFVRRENADGLDTVKPLTFVETKDGWRLKAGSI